MTGKNGEKSKINKKQKICLLDSSSDIKEFDAIIKSSEYKFITFDYESHKFLNLKNIPHEISDEFLSNDSNSVQNLTRKFSYWFKEKEIHELIDYHGINLGKLFYPELHYFLVGFLKKIFEINEITKKYSNMEFFTTDDLFDITKFFTINVKKITLSQKHKQSYLYDSYKIPIRIGNTNYSIKISSTSFKKFRNIFENFLKILFYKKYNISKNSSILFVEFDTLRSNELFKTAKKLKINSTIFNRRRPIIWNKESFEIIKKSNCQIINFNSILNSELKNLIYQMREQCQFKLKNIIKYDTFFKNYFSLHEFSFWILLKPYFLELLTKRSLDAILEIEIAKKIFDLYNFSNIVILSEHGFHEQILIELSKQKKIPITLLQHGVFFDTDEALEQNVFAGVMPIQSDFFCVWGDIIKKYSIQSGISPKKIISSGSIFYDEIFKYKKNLYHKNTEFILLALAWPPKNQINDLKIETLEKYEKSVREICNIISNYKKNLIVKIHPYSEQEDLSVVIKKINPKIIVLKNHKIIDLIKSCELFITLDLSTTILEAQILEKPVISINVRDAGLGNPSIFKNESCIQVNLDNFENEFQKILSNKEYREYIVKRGNNFVNQYISYSDASYQILSNMNKF